MRSGDEVAYAKSASTHDGVARRLEMMDVHAQMRHIFRSHRQPPEKRSKAGAALIFKS